MRSAFAGLVLLLAAGLVAVTLLPLSPSSAWFVRMWEFPRLQITGIAVAVGLAALALPRGARGWTMLAMAGVAAWQLSWVWPYTPWATEDVALVDPPEGGPAGTVAKLVSLNVLQGNEDRGAVLDYLRAADADLLLLMETDAAWRDALAPVLAGYATVVEEVKDDHYGMILATRLPVRRAELVRLSDDVTPAAVAELELAGGPLLFTGLHPRPPVPRTSVEARDEQIRMAALLARREDVPAIAMGDFNDVAWSWASQSFRDVGGYADPRAGRGIMASFDARSWWLKVPIDQSLVTEGVRVHSFGLGPNVGSDHLPVEMKVSVIARDAPAATSQGTPVAASR